MKDKGLVKRLGARPTKGWGLCLTMVLCLLTGSMTGYAQSAYFEYEDANNTIINGLTTTGLAASSLTVLATVTTVKSGTFSSNSAKVSTLIIEAGGNPVFASGLFGERENPLGDIQILGSSMTVANITGLLDCYQIDDENAVY